MIESVKNICLRCGGYWHSYGNIWARRCPHCGEWH